MTTISIQTSELDLPTDIETSIAENSPSPDISLSPDTIVVSPSTVPESNPNIPSDVTTPIESKSLDCEVETTSMTMENITSSSTSLDSIPTNIPTSPKESPENPQTTTSQPSTPESDSLAPSQPNAPNDETVPQDEDSDSENSHVPLTSERSKNVGSNEKELQRIEKWSEMMENWSKWKGPKRRKLIQRVRKGIPDRWRSMAWQLLANSRFLMLKHTEVFQECVAAALTSPHEKQIRRDVDRTFPESEFFRRHRMHSSGRIISTPKKNISNGTTPTIEQIRGSPGQHALYNVLVAFTVRCPDTGYAQGLGFIAGVLLMYLNEEEAFWMLVRLVTDYHMSGLFEDGLPLIQLYYFTLECLMKQYVPKLHAHFESIGVHVSIFSTQWFMTLFSYNFPFSLVLRIWDIFFSEGAKVIFRIAIGVLKILEPALLKMGIEEAIPTINNIPARYLDPDTVIMTGLKVTISYRRLVSIEQQYLKQNQS